MQLVPDRVLPRINILLFPYSSHPPTSQSGDRQLVSGGRQGPGVEVSKGGRHRPHGQPPVQIQSIDKKESHAQPASVHSGVKRSDSTSPTRDSGEMPIIQCAPKYSKKVQHQ